MTKASITVISEAERTYWDHLILQDCPCISTFEKVIFGRQSMALNMPEITTIQYTHQVEETLVVMKKQENRLARWYFGGMASAGAACCTHPLDLLKVHLQTQQEGKLSLIRNTLNIVHYQGILALYNGLSASLLRQLTYSTTRFGIYEVVKQSATKPGEPLPFYKKVIFAAISGAAGGFVGTPADMVNVRMQNDIKIPKEQRRNYKHAIDGLWRVYKVEGVKRLFSGAFTATFRAALMTVGQLSMYDQIKQLLVQTGYFIDNLITHFASSLMAGAIATTMTQPLDVLKTRTMNAKPGEYKSLFHLIAVTAKLGPLGFFKGYVPAFVRLGPHTIITFIFFEQLRQRFGFLPPSRE
ncbi:mitochondrial dicarboxylate carrier-like isoform X3 [Tachypleus tridentatus]|uniref:mitochondrial dicarboxylate carrier-like isoform X3 n=1 Tax=Tachypleus tridentatus TaxID=6853 RepID=UPI003FD50301